MHPDHTGYPDIFNSIMELLKLARANPSASVDLIQKTMNILDRVDASLLDAFDKGYKKAVTDKYTTGD